MQEIRRHRPVHASHRRHALALAAALAAQPAFTHAQTPADLPAVTVTDRADTALDLDKKNQTASRLGLSLRETPASVEVLTQELLERRGARTFDEALRGAVGISAGGNPGNPSIMSTRGFTGSANTYLFDGSRASTSTMASRPQDTWNFERIEVLKGPASVLHGEGAIGGAINFITKRPDRRNPAREGTLSIGSNDAVRLGVGIGNPIGETGAFRIDYSHNRDSGDIDRARRRLDNLTTGVSVDIAPRLTLDLTLDLLKDDMLPYYGTPLVPASFATAPTGIVTTADGRVIDRRMLRNNYNVTDGFMRAESLWARARLTWQIDDHWKLRNEFSRYTADRHWRNAETAVFRAPGHIQRDEVDLTHDHRTWTHRLDLSHEGALAGLRNRFVAGVEFGRTDFSSSRRFSDGSAFTASTLRVDALNPAVGVFDPDPGLFRGAGARTEFGTAVPTSALFAENALTLGGGVTLVAGLRTDRIRLERSIDDLNTGTRTAFARTYKSPSVRLGAVHALSPDTALYAQYTDALAPVGNMLLMSAVNTAFDLTRGKQVEVGLKQSFPEARFDWTLAAYRIVQDNVLSRDPNKPGLTVNNGSQSSRGIELSGHWRATPQLTVSGNLAALNARFDTLVEAGGVSRVGNLPPNVPERVANAWIDYRFAQAPVAIGLGMNRTGAMFTDNANTVRINGHTTADAYIRYALKAATVTLRVRNLTDKLYATWAGASASNQVVLAPRRSVELTVAAAF